MGIVLVQLLERYRERRRRVAIGRLIATADAARDARRWDAATDAYAKVLGIGADRAAIHVQYGHALKEAGDRAAARDAYERALALEPGNWDTWLQLGHVLKLLGRPEEAIAAYRESAMLEPGVSSAVIELVGMGAQDAIPDEARRRALATSSSAIDDAARKLNDLVQKAGALTALSHRSYDDFRHAHPILPPPAGIDEQAEPISMRIDGRNALAAEIRCTLDSLLNQTRPTWRATFLTSEAMADHPVASVAAIDPRVAFITDQHASVRGGGYLRLRAGTALDVRAVEWIAYVVATTKPAAAYSDHDHARQDWKKDWSRFDPRLHPRFDPFWFEEGPSPALVYIADVDPACAAREEDNGRLLCRIAKNGGSVVHIPRLLATIVDVRTAVAQAPADGVVESSPRTSHGRRRAPAATAAAAITIVIPIRDQPALLERCIATLIEQARFPDSLNIVVVDNRSVEVETAALLTRLQNENSVHVIPMDEPFNWSRANNLAVWQSPAPFLLFLNNDTEMLTWGWDDILLGHLGQREVGLVGAKLLYPDRTVQHAGILFGMNDAPPAHEGVGALESDQGPDGRWVRLRCAAAVTGAFMGMRRDTWAAVGGFDELAFPVGYNDVDMCLKVRATGSRVLYAPDLLLMHHESKTRGHTVTRAQVAWDLAELRALHARWGRALFDDPSLNPAWSRHGAAFGSYREPDASSIIRYIADQRSD